MAFRVANLVSALAIAAIVLTLVFGGRDPATPVAVRPDFIPTPPPAATAAPAAPAPTPGPRADPLRDPFEYSPDRRRQFEARAAAGNAHVLYALSPGGVVATAERVARYRTEISVAAADAGVSADMLEALVFLESAGREDVVAPQGIEGAAGLTQIVAETGTGLLGMPIDVARSRALTARIAGAPSARKAARLTQERRQADPRFDVAATLAATGRYLGIAKRRLGSEQLAFVSYHMGIGNLSDVLDAYAPGSIDSDLRYAQVYFDSSPTRHADAWRRLETLGDDSSNYLWKLEAARDIMAAHRTDPSTLAATAALQTAKSSAEEVLHPQATTPAFTRPKDLRTAYDAGDLVPLPVDVDATGVRFDPEMGSQAKRLGQPRSLYQGLRPDTLGALLYIAAETRAGSGDPSSSLKVTSTVRDQRYQAELVKRNPQATPSYSLHTTGFTFDILRRFRSPRQEKALIAVLDRLQSLNVVAYIVETGALHVTVSSEATAFEPLLDRLSS